MDNEIWKNLSLEDLPNEEWRDVAGYDGYYQVSNLGRVKSLPKLCGGESNRYLSKERIMKTSLNNGGYCCVNLHDNKGKLKRFLVHKIEAISFLDKDEERNFVDHINGIRSDNRIENLRWCTHRENDTFPLAIKHKTEAVRKYYSSPESRKKASDIKKLYYGNKDNIKKNSDTMKRLWSDDDYRKRFLKNKCSEKYLNSIRNTSLCKKVLQYDLDGNFIKEYRSAEEAKRQTDTFGVSRCCRGERKQANGYIWKYKE